MERVKIALEERANSGHCILKFLSFEFGIMSNSKGFWEYLRFGIKSPILNLEVSSALAASMLQDEGSSTLLESQFFDALGPSFVDCTKPRVAYLRNV
jgi:hypothetical protein